MTMPDNLKGDLYCIIAIETAEWQDEFDEKNNIDREKILGANE